MKSPDTIEEYELSVTKENNAITALSYLASMGNGKEGQTAVCSAGANSSDNKSVFSQSGNITNLFIKDGPDDGLKTRITSTKDGFIATFSGGSAFCGMGWGFPSKMVYTSGKKCFVTL
ncbi:hypothetical protein [Caballeronia insecticola]|uniref:hypothetical protein n=1 Tax=Caballeronia insecticola TaxID=758793 RepID=UPI0005C4B7FD|nr:hypothetical protein [Caballeronia insecticola]